MTANQPSITHPEAPARAAAQVGMWSGIIMALITALTFGLAITAIPISGAGCVEGCIEYPYLDTVGQFPKDYQWMIPAILFILAYVVWMAAIHTFAAPHKKVFSLVGLVMAAMAALVLAGDYFVQFSVVPVSLMKGETEGIALLTQYNVHGLFIVLEELGYLLMSVSFLFVAPVFVNKTRLEISVRWVFILGFVLTLVALAVFSVLYGLDREYRFEVAVISITWLVLLVNGILVSRVFRRALK